MFYLVETKIQVKKISHMANTIWHEAYKDLLTLEQIDYMLQKYLSTSAILNNIKEGYEYYLVKQDKPLGFMAIIESENEIFLSKAYLYVEYRKQGYFKLFLDFLKERHKTIRLTVNKFNQSAIDRYLKMGFKIIDSVVTDIGNGYVMDDYVLELKNDI